MVKKILTLFTSVFLLCLMAVAPTSAAYLWGNPDLRPQADPVLIAAVSIEAVKINMVNLTNKQIATGSLDNDAAGVLPGALSGQEVVWDTTQTQPCPMVATVRLYRSQERGGAIVSGTNP